MYEVKVLRTLDEVLLYVDEWNKLLENSSRHNIFHTPEMLISLTENTIEDFFVVSIVEDGIANALAIFLKKEEYFKLRFGVFSVAKVKVNRLRLLGDDVVIRDGISENSILNKVLETLDSLEDKFDYIILDNLKVPSSIWNYFKSHNFSRHSYCLKRPSSLLQELRGINITATYDEYWAKHTKKTRYNFRSRIKKLWKSHDDQVEVLRIESPEQINDFLDHVDTIFKESWRSKLIGYKKRNTASANAYMSSLARKGWFRSYILMIEGKPVSYAIGFQYAGVYTLEDIAYDKKWASFSVGSVLNTKLIEDLFSYNKPEFVDFGYGENEYKRILGNSLDYSCMAYLIPCKNIRWKLIIGFQRMLSFTYKYIDSISQKIGISEWLKKTIKRG